MAEDDERGDGHKPLQGLVLCSTSLGQETRGRVGEYAVALGAIHLLDLTKEVTHLIVGSVNTPKYQFVAKNRPDVKVLKLEWIEEIRRLWMDGEDVDITDLEEKHKYPVFADLAMCITGFVQLEDRSRFERTFTGNGATYSGDLSKQISHLIVAAPEGAKYEHAKQWGIICVSAKWVWDSLQRGMALDAALYDPMLPEHEQGKGAFRENVAPRAVTRKRPLPPSELHGGNDELLGPRKFRRTASTRLETHSQDMWQNLSAHNSALDETLIDQWSADTKANVKPQPKLVPRAQQPLPSDQAATNADKLFTRWFIYLHGFDVAREQKLKQVLMDNCGAGIALDSSELGAAVTSPNTRVAILIPHGPSFTPDDLPPHPSSAVVVTEWWVERSIMSKQVVLVESDRLSRPFWRAGIAGSADLVIASTGFTGVDLRQIADIAQRFGAKYDEYLSQKTSVLISADVPIRREKAYYAVRNGIPVVHVEWLWSSIDEGCVLDYEPYRVRIDPDQFADLTTNAAPRHAPNPELQNQQRAQNTHRKPQSALIKGPFLVDDDDDERNTTESMSLAIEERSVAPAKPQPLADRSPNASPTKRAHGGSIAKLQQTTQPMFEANRPPLQKPLPDLTADLASLSNQIQQNRRENSASATSQPPKKSRKLGRALSGILHRSVSLGSAQSRGDPFDLFEGESSGRDVAAAQVSLPPGTQLGYELPDAEAHRLQMARRMGIELNDESAGRKLASLGMVKDSEHVAAGGMVRPRRHRT